jgi:hypothetical protein
VHHRIAHWFELLQNARSLSSIEFFDAFFRQSHIAASPHIAPRSGAQKISPNSLNKRLNTRMGISIHNSKLILLFANSSSKSKKNPCLKSMGFS